MKLPIGLKIAGRYLLSKKTHNAVNIISVIAVATTAIAVTAVLIVLSVFNGFKDLAIDKYSRLDAPVKIRCKSDLMFNADSLVAELLRLPGVEHIVPTISSKAFLCTDNSQKVVELLGVGNEFMELSNLESAIIDGVGFVGDTLGVSWMVIGSGLATEMRERPGNPAPISIMVPRRKGRINAGSLISSFRSDTAFVSGVFRLDDPAVDDNVVIVPLDVARSLTSAGENEANALNVYTGKGFQLKELRRRMSGQDYEVLDLEQQNKEVFKMIDIEKWISFALLSFILIIGSFNIISTMTMLIIEKRDNMGTLSALGMERGKVRGIFMWEGLLLSLSGGVIGSIVGLVLIKCQQSFGWIKLSTEKSSAVLSIESYPVGLHLTDFFVVLGLVIILSVITTVISLSTFSNEDLKRYD